MNSKSSNLHVIDDDHSSLRLLEFILKQKGYNVTSSTSGEKALNHFEKEKPDLILLDILMPHMDGYEVCRKIKQKPEIRDIPVIFITASNDTEELIKGFDAGAVDFISKPINKPELLARVNTHLELKQSRDQLADANLGLLNEIENRKQAEEKFKALSETAFEAILFLKDNHIIEANKSAREIFGFPKNGEYLQSIETVLDEKGEKVLKNIIKTKETGPWELMFYKSNGESFYGLVQHQFIRYKGEKINVIAVRDITRQKEHDKEILNAILETQENERKRFSRDLHDGLGAILSTLKIYAGLLQKEDKNVEEKKELLREMKAAINDAVESARTIANNIMPSLLMDHGFLKALKSFVDAINKTDSVKIELMYPENLKRFDNNTETHLYRILLELINNTLKHANAKTIHVEISRTNKDLFIDYKDDGKGFDFQESYYNKDKGQGLRNIFSRVNFLNGKGTYLPTKDKSLHFRVEIPL
ncbi:MAG: response regulator [Bacteroidetes bacterium]|nr:MAG: response regulator [Bacteroidota bacterium]